MATGTGLDKLQAKLPQQYIDVGIAEQHAVTLAAGLACEGMPGCGNILHILTTRLRSIHDVCIQTCLSFLHGQSWNCRRRWSHPSGYVRHCLSALPSQYGLDGSQNEAELQQMVVTGVNYTDGPSPCAIRAVTATVSL